MTANDDDERDGLDIQSLSVVEAEFFYNKTDEGKSAADIAATKRTINLDAFHIIKVIGKGNYSPLLLLLNSAVYSSSLIFRFLLHINNRQFWQSVSCARQGQPNFACLEGEEKQHFPL